MVWVDRTGALKEKVGPPQDWLNFRLSADESEVAFAPVTPGKFNYDVTVFDLRRGTRERLTSEAKNSLVPLFSPDGKQIAFCSNRTGRYNPYITDGPNREKLGHRHALSGRFSDRLVARWQESPLLGQRGPVDRTGGWPAETIRCCEDAFRGACGFIFTGREMDRVLVE